MNYYESNPCYDSNYFGFDQIKPSQYSVNPSLNIQNELDDHELFINELIQQKLQNENTRPFPAIAITLDLPTVKPEDSLRMGDEHLDTILEMKSDEFIKSCVENLVPSPSESKDEYEYIPNEIYSNPLFDEEIISIKMDPHHFNTESDLIESLLNQDSSIISSSLKIDSLFDEFAGELILLKSIPSGIDEVDCDPEEEIRLIERLLIMTLLWRRSICFLLLMDQYPRKNESFHFDILSSPRPPVKLPDDDEIEPNLGMLSVKVVDDISEHYVPMPRLLPTQSTLASNQGKSPHLLSHRALKLFSFLLNAR
nr:hypothetical protein [Tanacetum cinerariifolium]